MTCKCNPNTNTVRIHAYEEATSPDGRPVVNCECEYPPSTFSPSVAVAIKDLKLIVRSRRLSSGGLGLGLVAIAIVTVGFMHMRLFAVRCRCSLFAVRCSLFAVPVPCSLFVIVIVIAIAL